MLAELYDKLAPHDLGADPLLEILPGGDGYKVIGSCVLLSRIGHGGTSVVYRGRHAKLDIDVAVKCLFPEKYLAGSIHLKRFRREARIAASISHQNLVRVFEIEEAHGLNYLVMERIPGPTLRQYVKSTGRLSISDAIEALHGAARGVAAAHEAGTVHRDIKPANILLSQTGDTKVADLGLAKSINSTEHLTAPAIALGTPRYMSPEQWRDLNEVGPAGDIRALGATLYFALAGRDAVDGVLPDIIRKISLDPFPDVVDAVRDVPHELAEIVRRCTRTQPEERFAGAPELVEALEKIRHPDSSSRDRSWTSFEPDEAPALPIFDETIQQTLAELRRRPGSATSVTPRGACILVVEDDADIARALDVRLTATGYRVVLAHDGVQGATLAVKHAPDMILMDISMPAGDGLTVAGRLLELAETRRIPVAFMTASKDADLRIRASELGAAAFFEKPFAAEEVVETIDTVLRATRA